MATGHMHQSLRYGGQRDMVAICAATGTVHINAAVVPRVRTMPPPPLGVQGPDPWDSSSSSDSAIAEPAPGPPAAGFGAPRGQPIQARHFVTVELRGGAVVCASNVWLARGPGRPAQSAGFWCDPGSEGSGGPWRVLRKEALLRSALSEQPGRLVRRAWRASCNEWETVVSPHL